MTLMENDGDREVKRAVGERSKAVAGRAAPGWGRRRIPDTDDRPRRALLHRGRRRGLSYPT